MKVKITELKPESIWKHRSHEVIGMVVDAEIELTPIDSRSAWSLITPKEAYFNRHGVWCKYIEVPEPTELKPCWKCGGPAFAWKNTLSQYNGLVTCLNALCMDESENYTINEWQNQPRPEPSAMSELGKYDTFADWLNGRFGYQPAPKKLSWIQKIRGYDKDIDLLNRQVDAFSELSRDNKKAYEIACEKNNDLCARIQAVEAMRDHYKTIMTEALRDRDLHAKVADNWQAKLIDQNSIIGKRLKFSVGHNHVTIVVGNPVTYCQNLETDKERIGWSASMCSKKDVYNWKIGVIQSLDNLCEEKKYSQKLRRDLRKALAKKYPDIFEATK